MSDMALDMHAYTKDRDRWFRRLDAGTGARRRLFCFHHAGGGPSLYRDWPRHLAPDTEVWAAALPGREARYAEPPIDQMNVLTARLADALPLDMPFAFFGHSLGGMVGFELARNLHDRGLPTPLHLFVSACPAPHLCLKPRSRATQSDAELLRTLESFGATPKAILDHHDYRQMVLSVLRADFNLIDHYVAPEGREFRFPITAYAGADDLHVPPERVMAWEAWAGSGFVCRRFEGDHFYLNHQRAVLIEDMLARWNSGEARRAGRWLA